jgi:PAS domain S-box-containing protein
VLVEESAVLVVDIDGVIRFWSPGAERLLRHDRAAALGRTLDLIVPDEFRHRHWDGFHRAMESGKSYIDGAAAVLPVQCGDGSVQRFAARLSLIRDPANRVVGAMATYTEVSEVAEPLPVLGG